MGGDLQANGERADGDEGYDHEEALPQRELDAAQGDPGQETEGHHEHDLPHTEGGVQVHPAQPGGPDQQERHGDGAERAPGDAQEVAQLCAVGEPLVHHGVGHQIGAEGGHEDACHGDEEGQRRLAGGLFVGVGAQGDEDGEGGERDVDAFLEALGVLFQFGVAGFVRALDGSGGGCTVGATVIHGRILGAIAVCLPCRAARASGAEMDC